MRLYGGVGLPKYDSVVEDLVVEVGCCSEVGSRPMQGVCVFYEKG
jgi:hypothetical protein